MNCYYCGAAATHLCKQCGHWLCDSGVCARRAAAGEIVNHPIQSAAFAIRHPVQAAQVVRRAAQDLLPPAPGNGRRFT
jgi:hypothetical protein